MLDQHVQFSLEVAVEVLMHQDQQQLVPVALAAVVPEE
tara:strand:- start:123 stop:236 length:114 start_codon:yes stop_codon:yes gene_type:complete